MGKKKKGKLPKEVLGVKLPKELRKAGDRLIEQAQGPAGRQAIAGALTAVAGAAMTAALARGAKDASRATKERDSTGAHEGETTSQTAPNPGEIVANMVNAFVTGMASMKRS